MLDDYEEGTFPIRIKGRSRWVDFENWVLVKLSRLGFKVALESGSYTRIGGVVYINMRIFHGGGDYDIYDIDSLPFQIESKITESWVKREDLLICGSYRLKP